MLNETVDLKSTPTLTLVATLFLIDRLLPPTASVEDGGRASLMDELRTRDINDVLSVAFDMIEDQAQSEADGETE